MKQKLQDWLAAAAAVLLVSLYPCLFQYAQNIPESRAADMLLFWGIFFACGAGAFAACLAVLRKPAAAGFMAGLAELILVNFGLLNGALQGIFPRLHGYVILGVLGLAWLALLILLVRKRVQGQVLCLLLVLMFGALCLVNGIRCGAAAFSGRSQEPAASGVQPAAAMAVANGDTLPNVYYYIYDEYGGPENLNWYYGYDNSSFYAELESLGFACSMDSYNLQSVATVDLVPDLYGLDKDTPSYFDSTDGQSPLLYKLFHDMGYEVHLISHNDFLDRDGAVTLTKSQAEDSICRILYQNSLLPYTPLAGRLQQLPQLRASYGYELLLQEVLNKMEQASSLTAKAAPTLTLGYVQLPHTWFVYDRDGNPVPEEHYLDWEDPQYYLGQLEYTNGRILKAVREILKNDPEAVIILQSDHGARYDNHMEEIYGDSYTFDTLTHEENILNCVYAGGRPIDISGLSGINTLRTVLNAVYGMQLEQGPY